VPAGEVVRQAGLKPRVVQSALVRLEHEGRVQSIKRGSHTYWAAIEEAAVTEVKTDELQCPKCGSSDVELGIVTVACRACTFEEGLQWAPVGETP